MFTKNKKENKCQTFNLFLNFNNNRKTQENLLKNIKKNTKDLILSNDEYSSYRNELNKKLIKFDFKKPQFRNKTTDENNKEENNFYNNTNTEYKTITKTNFFPTIVQLKKKSRNKDENYFNKKKFNINIKNFYSYNLIQTPLFVDPYLLLNILFKENNYSNLIYDEEQIFSYLNEKINYSDFIFEKIKKIKENIFNEKNELNKSYNINNTEISINLKSLLISFDNVQNILLPFNYLYLFYFKGFKLFKYIILILLKFQGEKFFIDNKNLKQFINTSSIFKNKNEIKEDKNKKEKNFLFLWLVDEKIFKVNIKLPSCFIKFHNIEIISEYLIPKDLMLFLLKNNFENWEFYILNYLMTIKNFRHFFGKNFSKKTKNVPKLISNTKTINLIDENNLKNKFIFFNTDENGQNFLNIIKSFFVVVKKFMKKFEFNFSLHQMVILSIINKFEKLSKFFPKILIENKFEEKISINNEFFEHFEEKYFSDIFSHNKNDEHHINTEQIIKPLGTLKLNNPIKINNSHKSMYNLLSELENFNENYNKFSLEIIFPLYEIKEIFLFEIKSNKTKNIRYNIKIQNIPKLFNSDKIAVVNRIINEKKNYIFKEETKSQKEELARTLTSVKGKKSFSVRKSMVENNIKGTLGIFKNYMAINRSQTKNFNNPKSNSNKRLSSILNQNENNFFLSKKTTINNDTFSKDKNIEFLLENKLQNPLQFRHKSDAKVSFFLANNNLKNNSNNALNSLLKIKEETYKKNLRKIKTSSFNIKDE